MAKQLDGSKCHLVCRYASAQAILYYMGASFPQGKERGIGTTLVVVENIILLFHSAVTVLSLFILKSFLFYLLFYLCATDCIFSANKDYQNLVLITRF